MESKESRDIQDTPDKPDTPDILDTTDTPDTPDTPDTKYTVINYDMSQSLDDYYCDDYDDSEQLAAEYLITCENCGNRWDGYAQCNCYQIKYDDEDLENTITEDTNAEINNETK